MEGVYLVLDVLSCITYMFVYIHIVYVIDLYLYTNSKPQQNTFFNFPMPLTKLSLVTKLYELPNFYHSLGQSF